MGNSRWLSGGLLMAFGGLMTLMTGAPACVSQNPSCGGPTSDLPYCDHEDSDPTQEEGVTGGSTGGGNTGNGSPPGAADSDAGVSIEDGDVSCVPEPVKCFVAPTPLAVEGTSPEGAVTIASVSLDYISAYKDPMLLRFDALIAGRPQSLRIAPQGEPEAEQVVVPGSYVTGSADPGHALDVQFGCFDNPVRLAATLDIFEHTRVSMTQAGLGMLRGELRVTEAGWGLTIPFVIDLACREVTVE